MNSKISAAKTAIVLDQPFFGTLVCNLRFQEDIKCETAWTDGTTLGFNPAYIDTLTHAEIVGLLCHEVMHCANGHPYRRDSREPKKYNEAADISINPIIIEAGMTLPKGSLQPSQYGLAIGKSAEWYFDRIPDRPPNEDSGKGQGKGCDSVPGEVRDSPSPEEGQPEEDMPLTDGHWQEITRQAATQAKAMGNLPASLDRFAKQAAQSRVDWKAALRKFVQQNAKADYTWQRPSTRYIAQDIYMPSLQSEDMPPIAIAVDTSGSMDDIALAKAKAEVLAVMDEVNPTRIDVLYADARVAKHDTFERGEEIVFQPAGGGGTSFIPVFEAIDAMDETPCCIVYITDLCGSFPKASSVPTLWVTDTDLIAPFGETIKMQ